MDRRLQRLYEFELISLDKNFIKPGSLVSHAFIEGTCGIVVGCEFEKGRLVRATVCTVLWAVTPLDRFSFSLSMPPQMIKLPPLSLPSFILPLIKLPLLE